MDIETFRNYCISKPGVTEGLPFDQNTLVFKVMGKMFTATGLDQFEKINLKCDPEKAQELRTQNPAVQPGYHMNKKHWNTIIMDGSVPDVIVNQWIDESYDLVVKGLPGKIKEEFNKLK